jgi:excisionase family DNA binding protein
VNGDLASALGPALEQLIERIARRLLELQTEQLLRQPDSEQPSPWMGIATTAEYLDWPRQRLYKLTAAGAIPHYKQEGRLLFHRHELDRWLQTFAQPVNALAWPPTQSYS